MRLALLLGLMACTLSSPISAQSVRVSYVFSDGNLPGTLQAFKQLLAERPDLRERVELDFLTESVFELADPEDFVEADVMVFDIMNQQMLERFDARHEVDLIGEVRRNGTVLAVGEGLLPKQHYLDQGCTWDEKARAFWIHSGPTNQRGLLELALSRAGVQGFETLEPVPSLDFGYYHPAAPQKVFDSWERFAVFLEGHSKAAPGAPRVGIGFYKSTYYSGDSKLLDATIAEVERRGAVAVPFFGYPGGVAIDRMLSDPEGGARADVVLSFLLRFASFEAAAPLDRLDLPVINLISLYGRSEAEWNESRTGLSSFEGTFQVAVPEIAGAISPTVVGSQESIVDEATGLVWVERRPIQSRVELAVQRGLRYAALRTKPNASKRVALMFYNYPPGKATIGASYLNVFESLSRTLEALRAQGYDLGTDPLDADSLESAIGERARNLAGYSVRELQQLSERDDTVLVDLDDYEKWLDDLDPSLVEKIVADWGRPGDSKLMIAGDGGRKKIAVPGIRYGNLFLMPQPARGWGEDTDQLYHAKDLAPHHQYVAAYQWVAKSFEADAILHFGTHGTLEWLDGKDVGLSERDASDALIGDLPNVYVYNVDVVGEGLVAKRRGMATIIDHMVPPLRKGGLYSELAELNERINDHHRAEHDNPQLAAAYAREVVEMVVDLGIAKDLGLELEGAEHLDHDDLHGVQRHMRQLQEQNIPYGLHTFGRTPEADLIASTVDAVVSVDRKLSARDAQQFASTMGDRIRDSGERELDRLLRALRGGYVPPAGGGDPVRNPDAYATGNNFFGIDPDKVPKEAAWKIGVELADQMLEEHLEKHGVYPRKVSFVIWGTETLRHEGVMESQIFHLLGTRPVWDARGKVVDVETVPARELGRPRIDIVVASAAEGMFENVTRLIDKAVQQVKVLEGAENYVRDHFLATREALVARGYSEDDAERRAGVRIFDEPPGTFNLATSRIVEASGTWDSDAGIATEYLQKMGHGYGNGFWGESMVDVFEMALAGTEKIVQSSSSAIYGALDNDDMYMYMGGLASAVRSIDGANPELLIADTRNPGKAEMKSMDEYIGTELRSRYINPTWIEGMKKEGYAGAVEMRAFVEYLWGWDATVTEVVDDAMWQESFEVYVEDKHDLELAEFFENESPFAYQDLTARMVETIRKGYWDADVETERTLLEEFIDNVGRHGPSGAIHTSGNPTLLLHTMQRGRELELPAVALEKFRRAFESELGIDLRDAAAAAAAFRRANEPERPDPSRLTEGALPTTQQVGYRMAVTETKANQRPDPTTRSRNWEAALATVPVLVLLLAWRFRRR